MMKFDCEFLFAVLAEKHNAVIRKIREIPPWKWGREFLELEPQVLRFYSLFSRRATGRPSRQTDGSNITKPKLHQELKRIAIRFNDRRGIFPTADVEG